MASVARLTIIPMQDLLGLGSEGRMNQPGLAGGNWGWQFAHEVRLAELAARTRVMVTSFGRAAVGN
jgi:4-alpha-glucanotransferase